LKVDSIFWNKILGIFIIILNSFYILYGVSFFYAKYIAHLINIVNFNDITLFFFVLMGIMGMNIGYRVFRIRLVIKWGIMLSFLFISIFIFIFYINFNYPWITH
tara:strand:+ start:2122 stop:2433 length:312 start_codon:yes stop_codon:yes gene_type:complete